MERSTRETIQFNHPFRLTDDDELLPAGSYEVETIELQIEGISFVAYRRLSTTMTLRQPNRRTEQVVPIDPLDLAIALDKDAQLTVKQEQHRQDKPHALAAT